MALLAKRWGPKEQVRNAYLPFYRFRDGPVMSLWSPYDVTGDIPVTSLAIPGNVGRRINRELGHSHEKGGATVTKAQDPTTVRVQKGEIWVYRDIYYKGLS